MDIVVVFDYFGTDETFLEVGMDHTGTLRGFPAFQERPGTAFVGTGGQEGLQVQQAVGRFERLGNRRERSRQDERGRQGICRTGWRYHALPIQRVKE